MTETQGLPRVLLVDDEPRLLNALRRQLRTEFAIETATGAAEGLEKLNRLGPFAVVVSDFMMPGTNGAEFLSKAALTAPDTTRVLLTGQASLEDAAATVNDGQVYRLLLKPVGADELHAALTSAVRQHQLVVSERELLEQTLHGSIKALTDVLSLTNPAMFARATRMRRVVGAILDVVDPRIRWPIDLAAMLSQLGAVSLPQELSERLSTGANLRSFEQDMVDAIPEVSAQLLAAVPRLEPVLHAIRYSRKLYDGSGLPDDDVAGDDIPLGGRVLCLAEDFDRLTSKGMTDTEALITLNTHGAHYDPDLLKALAIAVAEWDSAQVQKVALADLEWGMLLISEVRSRAGILLIPRGQEVTRSLIARLQNYSVTHGGIAEPLSVLSLRPPKETDPPTDHDPATE